MCDRLDALDNKNLVVYNQRCSLPSMLVVQSVAWYVGWVVAQGRLGAPISTVPSSLTRWQPSSHGAVKINVDAALCKHTGHAAVGLIGRGASGQLFFAISYGFLFPGSNVLHLKTLTLFWGI